MEKVVQCAVCKKHESNSSKMLCCLYCFSSAHFKCRNMIENAVSQTKNSMFFCTIKCSEIYKRIVDMQNNKSSMIKMLSNELKNTISEVVATQMNVMKSEVRSVTAAIEASQDYLSAKFDTIVSDFKILEKENQFLKQKICDIEKSYSALATVVNNLECKVNKCDMNGVSNNAVLLGLPYTPNENVTELVCKTAAHIGFELRPDSLVSASRIFPNNKTKSIVPIKVVFKYNHDKELFFSKKKGMGKIMSNCIDRRLIVNGNPTYITIRDELTPMSMNLLRELRELQPKYKIKYVWPGREGAIFAKNDDNSKPLLIKTRNDLSQLIERFETLSRGNITSKH